MAIKDHSMSGSRSGSSNSDGSDGSGPDKDVEKNVQSSDQPLCGDSSGTGTKPDHHHLRVLSNCQRLSFGVGHVLNDLTASMWFSYMLVFLHSVDRFQNLMAGNLMLIGQVSDAIFTPFIGYESDRTQGIKKIGKRKTWHLVGTVCVMVSFPFLFTECITCSHAPSIAQFVYYAPFVVIFQFGWASTQISHLSFSSDYTPHRHERVTLQSIRNMFTVMSSLSVYGIFALLFYLEGQTADKIDDNLGPGDASKFQILALTCIGLGTIFNFIFHLGTKEKADNDNNQIQSSNSVRVGENSLERSSLLHSKMNWKDWLREHQFYQIAVVYMATRLYINLSQVYFPMYLTKTVNLNKNAIALLPLVTCCSSIVVSFSASYINKYLKRKLSYVLAMTVGISSCVWMYFVTHNSNQVYGCAVLVGASGSLLLITSLSMTSDLISANTESGAFVFGAMSFTDKLSNGVAVVLIENFHPGVDAKNYCLLCESYYRNVQVFIPGAALLVGFVALLTLIPQNIGSRVRAVNVLKVMENPARATGQSSLLTDNLQCLCGSFYTPDSICSTCGTLSSSQTNGSLIHNAEIHRHFDTDDDDDDTDVVQNREKRSLLGSSINSPTNDARFVTEYGSLRA